MKKKIICWIFIAIGIIALFLLLYKLLSLTERPERITYGSSFNTLYARELGLEWKEVYIAMLDDLNIKKVRLAAHWSMVEGERGKYNFKELDYQLEEARKRDVEVIFAVGRRLPRWPECHVPEWAQSLPWEKQKEVIREYITETVTRYKGYENIIYWQVENEPFLSVFAKEHCGELDVSFLDEEIALVKSLDTTRPILVTDSGNLGTWKNAYKRGDAFGTSVYVYFSNPELGVFRTILPPSFYRAKENIMRVFYGKKPTFLIELSVEPWLLNPIIETPLSIQLTRMDIKKFKEIVEYAKDTNLSPQYLWGAEWWYWLKKNGDNSMWEHAKELYSRPD